MNVRNAVLPAMVTAALISVSACGEPGSGTSPEDVATTSSAPRGTKAKLPDSATYGQRLQVHLQNCLVDAGWDPAIDEQGWMEATVPPEQQAAYGRDEQTCRDAFMAEYPPVTLGIPEFKALYKQELAAASCLDAMGIPQERQPISEQQYVDDYAAGRPPSWSAYEVVPMDRFVEAEKRCPQPSVDE